jgi:cysteine synthase B
VRFLLLEARAPRQREGRIAKSMVEDAERRGELVPGKIILEATSGNTGIGLAFIGRLKGYQVKAVMPDNLSEERTQLLKAFGAEIVYSDGRQGTNGAIVKAQEMVKPSLIPVHALPVRQPGNPAPTTGSGPRYCATCPMWTSSWPAGTGGTLTGVGHYLREHKPGVKIIATAPHPGELVQGLRSLEDGFVPEVFDESVLDGKMLVDSRTAFAAAKELTEKEGIFSGISAGAVVKTAQRVAQRLKRGNVVLLLADGGWKYLSTELWTKEYADLPEDIDSKMWW